MKPTSAAFAWSHAYRSLSGFFAHARGEVELKSTSVPQWWRDAPGSAENWRMMSSRVFDGSSSQLGCVWSVLLMPFVRSPPMKYLSGSELRSGEPTRKNLLNTRSDCDD